MTVASPPDAYWNTGRDQLLGLLETRQSGLTSSEAQARLEHAPRAIGDHGVSDVALAVRQFKSPIVLLLIGAATLSFFLGETIDAVIIGAVIFLSALLGFVQERGAVHAVDALLASVRATVLVFRDGSPCEATVAEIVTGDIVKLSAGDIIPGDGVILSSNQLLVDESALTGESFPRAKNPGVVEVDTGLAGRSNCLHLGTHVVSGEGCMLVMRTGTDTEYGKVAEHVVSAHVPTAFERGATAFGVLLLKSTVVLVVAVFIVNMSFSRPFVDSLLFSLALAVGLTPQILPAIITLSLSKGASYMAKENVIVKRLDAIEDIGSLDVLFTDKTGTITVGTVALHDALTVGGARSDDVFRFARWNAALQTGYRNPIDEAVLAAPLSTMSSDIQPESWGEVPYDFVRKRISVWVHTPQESLIVTKGAVAEVLMCCDHGKNSCGAVVSLESIRQEVDDSFRLLSTHGFRVLGVATKDCGTRERSDPQLSVADESGMVFEGFLVFDDPPKFESHGAIQQLQSLGVDVGVITGDNRFAASYVARAVGISVEKLLTGAEVESMNEVELIEALRATKVFAEVSPLVKERIVHTASLAGHTVGYMGDGINDAPSLRIADVGISVDTAVGVAKQTADVVLLEKDLGVLADGIAEGRRVFANTLKYVHVTTSASFGNMVSLASATLLLPFIPMMPTQILVLNFLSDLPAMTISTDRVDSEQLAHPVAWDIRRIRNFMLVFGLASTVFDLLTFWVMRGLLHSSAELTRSAWFIESSLTEIVVMLVLRTRRFFLRSHPSGALLAASGLMAVFAIGLPFSPLSEKLGFESIPLDVAFSIMVLVAGYVVLTESLKLRFSRLMTPARK